MVKFTLEQATKTQRGSRGIALLFLTDISERSITATSTVKYKNNNSVPH
jgi:hypothetical protein